MRTRLLVLLLCASACGKTRTAVEEPFLSQEDIQKHNIPQPDSVCPGGEVSWPQRTTVRLPSEVELQETPVDSAVDSCGNLTIAWASVTATTVVRVLSDGNLDWVRSFDRSGERWHGPVRAVAVDQVGGIFVATTESIVPLAATGIRHPHAKDDIGIRTEVLENFGSNFVVGLPGYAEIRLPEVDVIQRSTDFNVLSAADDHTIGGEALLDGGIVRFELIGAAGSVGDVRGPSTGDPVTILRALRERAGGELGGLEPNPSTPTFEHEFEGELSSFASGSEADEVAIAYSTTPPQAVEDGACESWIRWESRHVAQQVSGCGLAQDVTFGQNGTLYVLWLFPGESGGGRLQLMKWEQGERLASEVDLPGLLEGALPVGTGSGILPSLSTLSLGPKGELIISAPQPNWEEIELLVVHNP